MAMAALLVAAAAACGGDDDGDGGDAATTTAGGAPTSAGDATTSAGSGPVGPPRVQPNEEAAACVEGKTLEPVALTVATGDPAFPPYVIDDDPTSGQGFESAVVYAVAGMMGIGPAAVTWVRTPFEAAIAPGPKDFDFNIQQYGITPDREEVVSFSQAYYRSNQAILGYADSPAAGATTLSDYQDLVIGVAAGTTALDFVTDVIQPSEDPLVFNDNAAAKTALDAKQIDAIVADLPTAIFMATVEIEGAEVFGQFPPADGAEGESWGMLFAKDNPLVECVNLALAALTDSGQLAELTKQWMTTGTPIPDINLD
jgi:polar amino acid transport system substrate-binding protein